MKIVIISALAPPEPLCAARMHWDIAEHLAHEDHEVCFISPYPSRPLGSDYSKDNYESETRISENLVHIRINSYTHPAYSLFLRTFECLDFGIRSIRYVNKNIGRYDLLYASPWAFMGHLMILLFRRNKEAAFVMSVQDLYPESLFVKISSATILKLLQPLQLIDRYIARRFSHITVNSESLRNAYLTKRKADESKLTVIQNWQDESEFLKPLPSRGQILRKFGFEELEDKFVFMYLGNIGPVAGVEMIISAFGALGRSGCALVIAGSGTHREQCRRLVENLHASDIYFAEVPVGLCPVVELQSVADVLMLPIIPEAADSSIPSKLIAYMFSSKPVITSANSSSETANAISASSCGWITENHDVSEWVEKMVRAMETSSEKLREMGQSGFDYAIRNYSRQEGLRKVSSLFNRLQNN